MSSKVNFSLTILPLPEQRYSCHGCGNCCRDFTVQLRDADWKKLQAQGWEKSMGDFSTEFRGQRYLAQKADGACVFLQQDGKCRIHAEYGLEAKPLACQLFPFSFSPNERTAQVGINFSCASVLANQGASLASHRQEIVRLARDVPELQSSVVMIDGATQATSDEIQHITAALDSWLCNPQVSVATRVDGLAWLAQQLSGAKFSKVRGERLKELLQTLVSALQDELPLHPVLSATSAQQATLRQAAFFRLADPKIGQMRSAGRLRSVLSQYLRSRAFSRGKGAMPVMNDQWPSAEFAAIERVTSLEQSSDAGEIDELLVRWMRATLLGGRAWGSGFYGWPVMLGLQAMALNVACAAWLARAHAAGAGRSDVSIDDVRKAVGRVDRACGRAPWLGSRAESLRLRFLRVDDGLRRICRISLVSAE